MTATFANTITGIPYNPRSEFATGFITPIMRAIGHILYAAAAAAATQPATTATQPATTATQPAAEEAALPQPVISEIEIERELQEAYNHLSPAHFPFTTANTSLAAQNLIETFVSAIRLATLEYSGWTSAERIYNLKALANAAAGIAVFLDYELLGISGSNPGSSL